MRSNLHLCRLFVFGWFLICGATAFGQEARLPDPQPPVDHGDAHANAADHAAMEHTPPFRAPESYVMWIARSMGIVGVLTLGAGAFCFVVTLLVVIRGQGPFASTAILLLVPIPFLIGLFGLGKALIASFQVISYGPTTINASEVCVAICESMITPMLGLIAMVPSYLVATLGSIARSFAKPATHRE